MNFESRMQNDSTLWLLVAKLIDAACEVYDCHCDPYTGEDDVLAERAGIDKLGLAIAALDTHCKKENV